MIWINYREKTSSYDSAMYICICHAVSDSTIRKAVDSGARSLRDLSMSTGCGTQCGSCVKQAREILDESLLLQGMEASKASLEIVRSG
jgi:bacterioferritin-associated ferredoxin